MKQNTFNELIKLIHAYGPLTKKDLQNMSGLKLTTLNRFLVPLFESGFIKHTSIKTSTGGRPSTAIDMDDTDYGAIGIDISRTYIKVILTNLKNESIAVKQIELSTGMSRDEVIELIENNIDILLRNNEGLKVLSIGIGSVGPVDMALGVLNRPHYLDIKDWKTVNIRELLEERFNIPVYVNSGANLALLAETYRDLDKQSHRYAYINCGVGIRNSTMLMGKIIQTLDNREDTLAHTIVMDNLRKCYCGSIGCIDSWASIRGIVERYNETYNKDIAIVDYLKLLEEHESVDNHRVNALIKEGAHHLGLALANYIKLFTLDYVILSGPLVDKSRFYYNTVVKVAIEYLGDSFSKEVEIIRGGRYPNNSMAIGGAIYGLQNYFNKYIDEVL